MDKPTAVRYLQSMKNDIDKALTNPESEDVVNIGYSDSDLIGKIIKFIERGEGK